MTLEGNNEEISDREIIERMVKNTPIYLKQARRYLESMWGVPLTLGDRMLLRKSIAGICENLGESLYSTPDFDIEIVLSYLITMAKITDPRDKEQIDSCVPTRRLFSKIRDNLYCSC